MKKVEKNFYQSLVLWKIPVHLLKIKSMPTKEKLVDNMPPWPLPHEDMGPEPDDLAIMTEFDDRRTSKIMELGNIGNQIEMLRVILSEKEIMFKKLRNELGL